MARYSMTRVRSDRHVEELTIAIRQGAGEGVAMLNGIWTGILGSGAACSAHRELYPALADCDVCIKEYGPKLGARSETIAEVAQAVKLLEGSPLFVEVMPEVSVNLACVAGDASDPADVIAVPGRIVRVKDRAKAMLSPEAGASAHMSKVLLLVRRYRPEVRACINLLYNKRMSKAIGKLKLRAISVRNYPIAGEDPTIVAMMRGLNASPDRYDAIIDEGGSGIEPNVYLFAKGAREAAELALKVARSYSAA